MSAKDARGVAKPSRKMVAEAAAWITRLHGSSRSAEVEAGFREWLAADAGHAAAFEGMTEIWDTMPAVPAGQLPRVVVLPRSPVSRPWVRAAAAIALCAVIACAFVYLPRGLSYATETGEQRIVNLDDGSRVSLNSGTRMAIRFADHERRIVLEEGEAYFEVAQDSRRPFVVVAGTHRVTALGTSFVVRYEGDRTAVVLVDGKVSVTTPQAAGSSVEPVVLAAGERLTFANGGTPRLDRPRVDTVAAWRRGELIFDSTLLVDAVAEMNRYDRTPLVIDDPAVARLPVSGIYRTGDSPGFARMVAQMYGIRLVQEEGRIHLRR